jgi:acetylornithine deacetylase
MDTTLDTLASLVAFPTVSQDSNDALIRYVAARLTQAGGAVRVLPGMKPGKSNLFARFGPDTGRGLVLSGHSDVVPVRGQDWASDPFRLTEREGRLHARGAVDMKGFIASMITAATKPRDYKRPLHLAISYDEEIGCVGVRDMLQDLAGQGFRAAGCIIGEPTGLQVATGHKGKIAGCICCRGEAAHSANPTLGVNAINLAGAMIRETEALQDWLIEHGARDEAYALPYSSVHIGTIQGGTVLNIVPERCDMEFEIRFLPGDVPEELIARLRAAAARLTDAPRNNGRSASIEINIANAYPGLQTPEDAPITQAVAAAAGNAAKTRIGFGTEAGLFDEMLGLPCVVCGPGSIDRAHRPDEYITRAELEACDRFLERMIEGEQEDFFL